MNRFLLCLALLCTCPALAAPPSTQSIDKLSLVVPYERVFEDALVASLDAEAHALQNMLLANQALTDDEKKAAFDAFDSYAKAVLGELKTPTTKTALKTAYTAAAKKHYLADEVAAQLAFYGSEAGKRAIKKEEAVVMDFLKQISPSTFEDSIQKHRTAFQTQINQILQK